MAINYDIMNSTVRVATVAGKSYMVWSDFIKRATLAQDEEGRVRTLRDGGYIHNDLTVRKALQIAYGLDTFRK